MEYPLTGYHHITACVGGAQEDVDFFTNVVGLRMAKQTVLMDGKIPIYHLYYSNANLEPGSVMTTFPYGRRAGRQGSGQVYSTSFVVPAGSLGFWKQQLDRHKVPHGGIEERFGQSFIRFSHPSGLTYEVIEDPNDKREGWTTPEIAKDTAVRGFHGSVLSVREVEETERFFKEALGFRKTGVDGAYHRFETGTGGANKTVTLVHEPDRNAGSWTFGAGTVHHIALWGADDAALAKQKEIYEELGYTDASEIKDRFYFHSMYCRCPGGILIESCCNIGEGFERDEPRKELGKKLHLPPWWEHRKEEMMKQLEPITVPETATGR
jgi:catechol 2,3-dioxygenase-like lactoylglutathione lyase family enzyme